MNLPAASGGGILKIMIKKAMELGRPNDLTPMSLSLKTLSKTKKTILGRFLYKIPKHNLARKGLREGRKTQIIGLAIKPLLHLPRNLLSLHSK